VHYPKRSVGRCQMPAVRGIVDDWPYLGQHLIQSQQLEPEKFLGLLSSNFCQRPLHSLLRTGRAGVANLPSDLVVRDLTIRALDFSWPSVSQ